MPSSTAEALAHADKLKAPSHLRVWINKKFPEILAVCFDGTAFGTQEVAADDDRPSVQAHHSTPAGSGKKLTPADFGHDEDDLPL